MVAYSFRARFCQSIIEGKKRQTIRAPRRRHASVGDPMQLYTAMRTKHCRKILDPDPICESIEPVRLLFGEGRPRIWIAGEPWPVLDNNAFARIDGFDDMRDMMAFWNAEHGDGKDVIDFSGVLIKWRRRVV
jgi:hypothetical protein